MLTREAIVAEARSWEGTPYRHQGMTKGAGADCLGFLAGIALALDYCDARPLVRDERYRSYGRMADPAMLDEVCETYLDRIDKREAKLGDVLQMIPPRGVYRQHFAIVSALGASRPTHIIECTSQVVRGVTEHIVDDEWWGRVKRAYTWRGVA